MWLLALGIRLGLLLKLVGNKRGFSFFSFVRITGHNVFVGEEIFV